MDENKTEDNYETIKSPIVGTFYRGDMLIKDNTKAYFKIGDSIDKNDVVCTIEAMMVPNAIKAGIKGTIEKILASSGDAVDYDQPLFKIKLDNPND